MKWSHHWKIRSQTRITSSWGILLYGNFCTNQNMCYVLLFILFFYRISTIVHKDTRFVCKSLVFYWKFILFDCFEHNAGASSWDKTKKKWQKKEICKFLCIYRILCWTRLYFFYPFFHCLILYSLGWIIFYWIFFSLNLHWLYRQRTKWFFVIKTIDCM